jgi:hypothetical protein
LRAVGVDAQGRVSLPAQVNILLNNPPIVRRDRFAVTVGNTVNLTDSVLMNDFDPEKSTLLVITNTPASLGTALTTTNNQLFYTAGTNIGNDVFTYTVRDALGGTATTNVLIRILPAVLFDDFPQITDTTRLAIWPH